MKIPLSQPDVTETEIDAVVSVLRGSRLSIGPCQQEFESLFARYIGVPHSVAVSSGTAGLHLALLALGIGQRDEVIVPSFTFIAAVNAIRYIGADPVFVDIEPRTMNLDPALIETAITQRTRAILVVHTFGVPADMDSILTIARRHNLLVIEDACEALGADYHGSKAGSLSDAAVFAFYPNKQITTGEGGMVLTPHAGVARELRALRNQGRYESDDWLQHSVVGYNYRLSEMACALGTAQMERIESILRKREAVAREYHERLARDVRLELPLLELANSRISWFVYVVRLNKWYSRLQRDMVVDALTQAGIGCARYFAPVHLQPAYCDQAKPQHLPVSESVGERTVALPFYNRLSVTDIEYVCEQLQRALDGLEKR
jgi:perosamine synthetase